MSDRGIYGVNVVLVGIFELCFLDKSIEVGVNVVPNVWLDIGIPFSEVFAHFYRIVSTVLPFFLICYLVRSIMRTSLFDQYYI